MYSTYIYVLTVIYSKTSLEVINKKGDRHEKS